MPSQEDIEAQLKLLRTNRRTLAYGLEQLGRFGLSYVPPHVRSDIDDARDEIKLAKQTLRGWGVLVDDVPSDDAAGGPAAPDVSMLAPALAQVLQQALQSQAKDSDDDKLYSELQDLNYISQRRSFRTSVEPRSVAAYLIDGQYQYGQRWLLNMLLTRYQESIQAISIDLRRLGQGKSIAALCQEIARKAGVPASTPEELAAVLCRWWQTQHTILIFHSVDRMNEAYLCELLTGFWAPIASHACKHNGHGGTTKLLLFLVDNQGVAGGWNLPYAKSPDDDASLLMRLPPIARFSNELLSDWLETSIPKLPNSFPRNTNAEMLLEGTGDGVPERVLQTICAICDYDWNEGASRWLKH